MVAKGTYAGEQRGAYRQPSGMFRSDRGSDPLAPESTVRATAATPGQEVTYTCVPPGSGVRMGVDRDEDGFFDRDELDAGSDPEDPASTPSGGTTTTSGPSTTSTSTSSTNTTSTTAPPAGQSIKGKRVVVWNRLPGNPLGRRFSLGATEPASPNTVVGDPITNGATLGINISGAHPSSETFVLPPGTAWRAVWRGFRYRAKGVVSRLVLKKSSRGTFSIKVSGRHQVLVPPFGVTGVQAVLTISGGGHYCTSFGGLVGGYVRRDGLTVLSMKDPIAEGPCS